MVSITDAAKKKIITQLKTRGKGLGIKIGVKTNGCSGLSYILEFVDKNNNNLMFEFENFNVFVDEKASIYVNGLTIDYVKIGLNEGFEFINPNEKDRCGCGKSFRV